MVSIRTDHFSLEQICVSGQCFRMSRLEQSRGRSEEPGADAGSSLPVPVREGAASSMNGEAYQVIAGQRYLKLSQQGEECMFHCSQEEFEYFWKVYFDLENDYGAYISQINPRDAYLLAAADLGQGIRILRQDLWEMIVSFLISQQNNILRIRRCIENICREYGEKMRALEGEEYFGFPKPEALAGLDEDALMECNLGYRSKYVVRAARSVASGELNLNKVREMPYRKAREELLKLFGVGEKVADCICLFALHHLDAFPVDTHISQALAAQYKRGFPNKRYRGFRGVMQQYIFYYELHTDKSCQGLSEKGGKG